MSAFSNRPDSTRYSGVLVDGVHIAVWCNGGGGDARVLGPPARDWKKFSAAELSLEILNHFTRRRRLAMRLHQAFAKDVVARWGDSWQITGGEIRAWMAAQEIRSAVAFRRLNLVRYSPFRRSLRGAK